MGLIEGIVVLLVILWLLGFLLHVGGGLIHILLVLAIIVFAYRFIRKAA